MKRVICIVIVLTLIMAMSVSFAGCGAKEPSPTEVLDSYLSTIKAEGFDPSALNMEEEDMGELVGSDAEFVNNLLGKMQEFEYELSNEVIEEDKATVDVKITTYGLGSAFTETVSSYFQQAFVLAFSDASEEEIKDLFVNMFKEKLDTMAKSYEKTVTVEMVKGEEGWEIKDKDTDSPLYDALLGGLVTSVKNMAEAFGESE